MDTTTRAPGDPGGGQTGERPTMSAVCGENLVTDGDPLRTDPPASPGGPATTAPRSTPGIHPGATPAASVVASPLTAISPIRPGWTTFARFVLDVLPHTPWGSSEDLESLAFIHSARWTIVRDLWVAGRRRRPAYDYLLFESNFDGPRAAYLEAFADVLGDRMRLVWNSSYGFPFLPRDAGRSVARRLRQPIPGRPFVDYVSKADLGADHYYASTSATTREIVQGLHALDHVRKAEERERAGDATGAGAAWRRAHAAVSSGSKAWQPSAASGDIRGAHEAFTALSPIVPGREEAVRDLLAGWRGNSPFADVPGVHHARWSVVDDLPTFDAPAPDAWPRAYLLVTATLDRSVLPNGPAGRDAALHLQHHLGAAADPLYRHCEGYDSARTLGAHLARHRLVSQRFFSAYPGADTGTVSRAVQARARCLDAVRQTTFTGEDT